MGESRAVDGALFKCHHPCDHNRLAAARPPPSLAYFCLALIIILFSSLVSRGLFRQLLCNIAVTNSDGVCHQISQEPATQSNWQAPVKKQLEVVEVVKFPQKELLGGKPKISAHYFLDDSTNGRLMSGHISFAESPLSTFSVLEPVERNTCSRQFAPNAFVTTTSAGKNCVVASNAGFFDPSNGGCIGNVVSDGVLVQDSGNMQNANFGIRADGSFVVGYLDVATVRSTVNPFVQLVTGIGWLLRNGVPYVNESLLVERSDGSGLDANFIEADLLSRIYDVRSARMAIGHDNSGRLVLAQVDGRTGFYGPTLNEFALMLKSHGVVNAINLDGGGSTTFTINGSVVNYPPDECEDSKFICLRKVSTVICLHPPKEPASPEVGFSGSRRVDNTTTDSIKNEPLFQFLISSPLLLGCCLATSVAINIYLIATGKASTSIN